MKNIYRKIEQNEQLTYNDALRMLSIDGFNEDFHKITSLANKYTRNTFHNKGVIFAQIGVDAHPCSVNCKFCMLAIDNFDSAKSKIIRNEDIVKNAIDLVASGANEVFLMSTAEYDSEDFLLLGRQVRESIPSDIRLVANTADFDYIYAQRLKDAGFTGVYHICRLGEGIDTSAQLEVRINTLDAIEQAGLELYYCVEPIGPEHSNEQIATEIFRAVDRNINVMAVMRRICFDGCPMESFGEISAVRLSLICAVSVLCVRPKRAMGVHEPEILSLISGANQIYAECGSNPRDTNEFTETGRGFSIDMAKKMLFDADFTV